MATAGSWNTLRGVSLNQALIDALANELAFQRMTPVQAAAIPPLLSSKDVCVDAETGSGKTLSYLVPIAQTVLFDKRAKASAAIRALVIAPTRELAAQVHTVAKQLFDALPSRLVPVPLIGGGTATVAPDESFSSDLRVVIATPGRLAAALNQGLLNVSKLELLVLDEADRLLDMGFSVTLTDILTRLPRQRRTGIYSATQTAEVEALARAGLRNPVRVAVRVQTRDKAERDGPSESTPKRQRTPASLQCWYHVVSPRDKLAHMIQLLASRPDEKFIVYFMTCACVDYYRRLPLRSMLQKVLAGRAPVLSSDDKSSRLFCALHGKMSQAKREKALTQFATSNNGVLLCTDVAARGIDIPDVDWVIQFDPPQDPDAYIHRVGRTARLGRNGNALVYLAPSEDAYADFLRVRRCPVTPLELGLMPASEHREDACQRVRAAVREATLGDRTILDASEAAFLSYIRAYKEHKCRYLLKMEDIDIDSVTGSFGLLRLPRFHEFKRLRSKITFRKDDAINVRDIAYKDKTREKRRQEQIREAIANRSQRREALLAKSKKKGKKRKKQNSKNNETSFSKDRPQEGTRKPQEGEEEEEDFSAEAMLLRRVKRGKLSRVEFDEANGYGAELENR